jgi:hypothetical protein
MNGNVVFFDGRKQEEQGKDEARAAVRGALLDTVKSFRAGEIRAVAIITMETSDALGYRIAGECTDAEIISALEFIKFKTLVEA